MLSLQAQTKNFFDDFLYILYTFLLFCTILGFSDLQHLCWGPTAHDATRPFLLLCWTCTTTYPCEAPMVPSPCVAFALTYCCLRFWKYFVFVPSDPYFGTFRFGAFMFRSHGPAVYAYFFINMLYLYHDLPLSSAHSSQSFGVVCLVRLLFAFL
jgi:hypothetical protein